MKSDVEQAAELAKIEIPNLTFLNVPVVNIDDLAQNNLIDVNKEYLKNYLNFQICLRMSRTNLLIE